MKKILPFLLLIVFGCSSNAKFDAKIKNISNRLDTLEVNVSDNKIKINSLYSSSKETTPSNISNAKINYLTEKLKKFELEMLKLQSSRNENQINNEVVKNKKIENKISDVAQIYQKGREYYLASRYKLALEKFNYIIKNFPSNPLTANSFYWKGEVYYDLDDYISAMSSFQNVIDYFPKSPKAADAQFKIGLCYQKMNNISQAKIELNRIKKLYPNYERQKAVDKILGTLNE